MIALLSVPEPMSRSYLGKLLRGTRTVLLGMLFARAARYGVNLIIARMGADTWGGFSLGLAWLEIISSLACLGLLSGILRYVAFYRGKGDDQRVKGIILSASGMVCLTGCLSGLGLYLSADWVALRFLKDPSLTPMVEFIALIIPMNSLSQVLLKALLGGQAFAYYIGIWRVGENLVKLIVVLISYQLGFGLHGVLTAYALASCCSLLLSLVAIHTRIVPLWGGGVAAIFPLKELVIFSLPLFLSGFLGVVSGWIDTLVLGYFCDQTLVGIYTSALLLASLVTLGPDLLYPVILPMMTECYAQNRHEELADLFHTVTRWIVWMTVPAVLFVGVFAAEGLQIMFGGEYLPAAAAVAVLVLGRLVYIISWTRATAMVLEERTQTILFITLVENGINLGLNILLVPRMGILGAGWATTISVGITAIITFLLFKKNLVLNRGADGFLGTFLRICLAAGVAVGVARGGRILGDGGLWNICFCLAIFSICYILLLVLLRVFQKNDIYVLEATFRKFQIPYLRQWIGF